MVSSRKNRSIHLTKILPGPASSLYRPGKTVRLRKSSRTTCTDCFAYSYRQYQCCAIYVRRSFSIEIAKSERLIAFFFSRVSKLSIDASGSNSHHNCFNSSNLIFRDLQFPGNAKIVIHSGVTSERHGGGKVNENRLLLRKGFVIPRFLVEFTKSFRLSS